MPLPVLAKCRKCGRKFVSLPAGPPPWRDGYFPADRQPPPAHAYPLPDGYECNGEIVVVVDAVAAVKP